MKKVTILLYTLLFLSLNNCISQEKTDSLTGKQIVTENEYLVQSVLWYQQSAEMRAVYYQTFNMAKIVLDDKLMRIRLSKPAALIVDIDETMLDNSPFETESIRSGKGYSNEYWMEWTSMEKAKPLPGAFDFVKHATEKGVEVFYISNRYLEELEETINNLKKYDFPNADTAHILLRKDRSDKTNRRNLVAETHVVVMLVGDNLADFSQDFANRGEDLGFNLVDEYKDNFGAIFIILPNPMYGEWSNAIYKYRRDLNDEEKDSVRKASLRGFEEK